MSSPTWEKLKPVIAAQASAQAEAVREALRTDPALETEALDTGWREALRAQRATLLSLRRDGMLSEEMFDRLAAEVDGQLNTGFTASPAAGEPRTQFVEGTLAPEAPAAGKRVAEVEWPRAAVLVSIRREAEVIIPRGDTRLQAGDVVTVLAEREQAEAIRRLLGSRSAGAA
jgi:hypothetical protein